MDDTVYDSHAGGGYGDGTTAGTTGQNPLHNSETFDDKEDTLNDPSQQEALKNYQPKTEMTTPSTGEGNAKGLLPHERTVMVPDTGVAHVQHVPGFHVSTETEQAAAQSAQDGEISALSDLNGGDQSASDL